MEKAQKKFRITAPLVIILTFIVTILFGTICFCLPFATTDFKGLSFVNSLFLATSATCVTGLTPIVCSDSLSLFGQIILCILIEIGGLSFLTIVSFIFLMFGRKFDVRTTFLLKEQLNQESANGVKRLVINVISFSFSIQLIGAFILFFIFRFKYDYATHSAIKLSLFHAISSFNNAGFDLLGGQSLIPFKDDILLNLVTMALIILGGLGFIVFTEIVEKHKWRKFSLHTKIVIVMTFWLVIGGTLLFKLFMWSEMTWTQAMFSSVTARTAGFASFDMSQLSGPGFVLMILLMFIGASPCSTGGGFKTTSFFVLICSLFGFIKGSTPHAFKRKISSQQMEKTFALFILEITYIVIASIIITYFEKIKGSGLDTKGLIFEVVSAFATVGLSQNITPNLCSASKILIIVTMFLGRLGPLTIVSIWNNRKNALVEKDIKYVEGNIVIG